LKKKSNKRKISVFIASPGDLSAERKMFKDTINQLNVGFGDGADIEFEPMVWEDTLASTGRRNQRVINDEIDMCDVFILVMYRRWGQEAPDAKPYTSYTEEEFHRALERWKEEGSPEIFVFFKRVDAESEADPGIQLKKVMDFRKQLEETRELLYRYFDDEESFAYEVDSHLRAYAKDELPKADQQRNIVVLPSEALKEVEKAKEDVAQKIQEAEKARDDKEKALLKIKEIQLQIAEDAARLSREGKSEFARQKFSELVVETEDIRILHLGFEFFNRIGDINSALLVIRKWLNLSGTDNESVDTANAYENLGGLYMNRGDLDFAEEMFQRSLRIYILLDFQKGIASIYNKFGRLYKIWGDLVHAEDMCHKSLAIHKKLGDKNGIAVNYGNLGILYKIQGDLECAKEMYQKSLEAHKLLGDKNGIADNYANLGNLYMIKGDYKQAEKMFKKSLDINKELDHKDGIASILSNLGVLYKNQDDFDLAAKMFQDSLVIVMELGNKVGMAKIFTNLGNLYKNRGDLELAEEMQQKSLAICKALGHREGIANCYGNLGNLYQIQNDFERAEKMYKATLDIDEQLGRKEGMAISYGNLGSIYQIRGDRKLAEEMYQKSLHLYSELDSPRVEEINKKLQDLNS